MMKKNITFLIFGIILLNSSFAQSGYTVQSNPYYTVYYKNPILSILDKAPKKILHTYYKDKGYPIFKIQVVSTRSRGGAESVKSDLEKNFPDFPVDLSYREPFFKIQFGFFLTREEAEEYIPILNRHYFNQKSLVIVKKNTPVEIVDSFYFKTTEPIKPQF